MATYEMNGLDAFARQIEELTEIDEIAPKMINAASPLLASTLSRNIEAAASRGYATGALASSIAPSKAKRNNYGYFSAVSCGGRDSKGVRNGEKLAYLEYGVAGKQVAHPVMRKSINESEARCLAKMQEVFNREVDG